MNSFFKLIPITGWFLFAACFTQANESIISRIFASNFQEVRELNKLPVEITNYIEERVDNGIAPIDGSFEATDEISDPTLPRRRLKLAGFRDNIWFIWYEHGGRGLHQHLVIFSYSKENLELLYVARLWAKDLNDLKQKLVSGTVEDETMVADKHGYW